METSTESSFKRAFKIIIEGFEGNKCLTLMKYVYGGKERMKGAGSW